MKLKVLVVITAAVFLGVFGANSTFAQRPAPTPRADVFVEPFIMPAIPPMPPMPEIPPMPPMPPMPTMEGFSFRYGGQAETTDPAVRLQQEVFRTLLRNNPDRALDLAAERLKTDPADAVVLGNLSMIANISSPKALPLLVSIAKSSPNSAARRDATISIARTRGEKDGLTLLEDLYASSSDNVELRRTVVSSIGRLADPKCIAVLTRIVRSDADESVRRTAVQSLGSRKEPEALKALEDLLKEAPKTRG
jgi:HEAT repeats